MPISKEMFDILGDYYGLENLHPYGDFLGLYSLPIHASIAEAGDIFRDLRRLDDRILTIYVSYILSKAGYFAADFVEPTEDDGDERLFTRRFEDKDWLGLSDYFEHEEEGFADEWSMDFENEKSDRLRVFFITFLAQDEDPVTKEYSEPVHLLRLLEAPSEGKADKSVFVIHPRLSRKAKEAFIRTKEMMKQVVGQDIVFSPGQFATRFIPDENRRQLVEENWGSLRERILANFQKEWRILIYSIHDKQLSESRDQLRKARLKFESGNDYQGSVLDAGIACEGLLKILHSVFPKIIKDRMDFSDYLCDVRDIIIEDYGEDIYNDLEFIREWRNNVAHAPITIPTSNIALKVLTKSELFQALFLKNIKPHTSQQK